MPGHFTEDSFGLSKFISERGFPSGRQETWHTITGNSLILFLPGTISPVLSAHLAFVFLIGGIFMDSPVFQVPQRPASSFFAAMTAVIGALSYFPGAGVGGLYRLLFWMFFT